MHHQIGASGVCQRPCQQPLEQRVAVGSGEDLIERVGSAAPLHAVGDRQQVQIVIAEHHRGVVAEGAYETQRWPASAGPRLTRSPTNHSWSRSAEKPIFFKQRAQLLVTPLDVADCIARHCRMPGIARRKGGIGASKCAPSSASIW